MQTDLEEETGPCTVVSGFVNYILLEMHDKYLVVVVSGFPLLE